MRISHSGRFCDGLTPLDEDVEASFTHGLWTIRRSNGSTVYWPMTALSCEKQPSAVLYTHRETDATLLIEVHDDQDLMKLPGLEATAKVSGLRRNSLVAGLLMTVVILVTLIILAMRPLAIMIAQHISPAQERDFFGSFLPETFLEKHGCHDMEANEILTQLGHSLSVEERRAAPIDFMLLDWEMANAFAIPGRKMAVTTGLLRRLHSAEQLAAILSHELGHVQLRHNLSEFIRASFASFAWGLLVQDFSGFFVLDPELMKQAGERALSREAETEADRFGAERMIALGLSPKALASALDAITMHERDDGEEHWLWRLMKPVLDLFSTHPETEKRIAGLRSKYPQEEGKEPLSLQSWTILRSACALASEDEEDPAKDPP
jgi:predicted Zn-dependent protease